LHEARQQLGVLQDKAHAIQVETLKLSQAQERFRERQAQIDESLAEMVAEEETESERLFLADEAIDLQRRRVSELQTVMAGGAASVRAQRADAARRARAGQWR
jgi:chromosome segregation protein